VGAKNSNHVESCFVGMLAWSRFLIRGPCLQMISQLMFADDGEWKAIKTSWTRPSISQLIFAYDLLLFGQATLKKCIVSS